MKPPLHIAGYSILRGMLVVGWACVDGRVKSCISDLDACGRRAFFSFPCAKTHVFKVLRNGLLRYIPYTCPIQVLDSPDLCFRMQQLQGTIHVNDDSPVRLAPQPRVLSSFVSWIQVEHQKIFEQVSSHVVSRSVKCCWDFHMSGYQYSMDMVTSM